MKKSTSGTRVTFSLKPADNSHFLDTCPTSLPSQKPYRNIDTENTYKEESFLVRLAS